MTTQELTAAWKNQAQKKTNTAQQYIFCSLARELENRKKEGYVGKPTLEYLKRTFPPIVRETKLANGRKPYDTLEQLLYSFQQSPNTYWYSQRPLIKNTAAELGVEITEEDEEAIRTLATELTIQLRKEMV